MSQITKEQAVKKKFSLLEEQPHYTSYELKLNRQNTIIIDFMLEDITTAYQVEPDVWIIQDGGIPISVNNCKTIKDLDSLIRLFQ